MRIDHGRTFRSPQVYRHRAVPVRQDPISQQELKGLRPILSGIGAGVVPQHEMDVAGHGAGLSWCLIRLARFIDEEQSQGGRPVVIALTFALCKTHAMERELAARIYKVIEVVGSSETSVDDAIRGAVEKAAGTIRNLDWFEVIETRGHIFNGKVAHTQVTLKVGFSLD